MNKMDIKTPTSGKIKDQVIVLSGAITAAMASRGVATLLPGGSYGKLGFAFAAAIGAVAVTGKSTGAELAKGALFGMAVQQGVEAVSELAAPATQKLVAGIDSPKLKDFVSKTAGLGTPDSPYYFEQHTPVYEPQSALAGPYANQPLPLGS